MANDDELVIRLARKAKGKTTTGDYVNRGDTPSDAALKDDIDNNQTDELDGVLDSACSDIYDAIVSEEDKDKACDAMKAALLDFIHAATKGKVV
jgi:hypothetical protein